MLSRFFGEEAVDIHERPFFRKNVKKQENRGYLPKEVRVRVEPRGFQVPAVMPGNVKKSEKVYSSTRKSGREALKAQCVKDSWVHFSCTTHGESLAIQVKCKLTEISANQCWSCYNERKSKIIGKAMTRYKLVQGNNDKFVLWTLGTSLLDTMENRKRIRKMWKQFRKLMQKYHPQKYARWQPLMNTMEAGSKGNRLHYHVIVRGFAYQPEIKKIWRGITGEKSNVHFEYRGTTRKAVKAFAYLAKYSSEGYNYYWMGDMHKVTPVPFEKQTECEWEKRGSFSRGYRLQFQRIVDIDEYEPPPPSLVTPIPKKLEVKKYEMPSAEQIKFEFFMYRILLVLEELSPLRFDLWGNFRGSY